MGICSSCLGRKRSLSGDSDNSRLLFEDPHASNYGSFGDQNVTTLQPDAQDIQRETEALQRIVARTSGRLVDIFAMVPPNVNHSPTAFAGQNSRRLQYQDLLAKLSNGNDVSASCDALNDESLNSAVDWPSDDEDDGVLKRYKVIKSEGTGQLLGGFSDVENSIK